MIEFLFLTIVSLSLTGSFIFLIYNFLSPIFGKGISAKGNRRILCFLFFFFIIPFGSIIRFLTSTFFQSTPLSVEESLPPLEIPTPLTNTMLPQEIVSPNFNMDSILFFLAILWFIVATTLIGYRLFSFYRFQKKILKISTPVTDPNSLRIYKTIYKELDIQKTISIRQIHGIESPFITGLLRPIIVFPSKQIPEQEQSLILFHELTHYKQKDLWWKFASILLCSIQWFNPVVYLFMHKLDSWIEKSCDENVVRSMNFESRKIYAQTILSVLERGQIVQQKGLTTAFSQKDPSIKERIVAIMSHKNPSKKIVIASILTTTLLATGSIVVSVNAYAPTVPNNTVSTSTLKGLPSSIVSSATPSTSSVASSNNSSLIPETTSSIVSSPTTLEEDVHFNGAPAKSLEENLQYADPSVIIPEPEQKSGSETPTFIWPTEKTKTSSTFGSYRGHTGMDIVGTIGDNVYAADGGKVIKVENLQTGYGNYVIIDHGNGYQTVYAHCDELLVNVGDIVQAGDVIATLGRSGNTTGECLHFEIRKDGSAVNPADYVKP